MSEDSMHGQTQTGGVISEDLNPDTHTLPIALGTDTEWILDGRYQRLERIRADGTADVFRGRDVLLGRDVAIKVFRTPADAAGNLAGIAHQRIELQALAGLNHPNLVTLFDGSITGEPAFLVMELIDGPSLAGRLGAGPLPELTVRELGAQIADALGYIHARGIVHRDVKPANILLGSDDTADPGTARARLSDFGIVRMLGSNALTAVDVTLGTASYLAPEQARGSAVGAAADVYSLGLVLIEALTGVRCFDGTPIEAAMARLTRSPQVPTSLPQPWPPLLTAMTATDPAARPSAAEVADALRNGRFSIPSLTAGSAPTAEIAHRADIASGSAMTHRAAAAGVPPRLAASGTSVFATRELMGSGHFPRRHRSALLVGALAVAGLIGAAGWALEQPTSPARIPADVVNTTSVQPGRSAAPAGNAGAPLPVAPATRATHTTWHISAPVTRKSASDSRAAPTTKPVPTPATTASTPTATPSPTAPTSTHATGTSTSAAPPAVAGTSGTLSVAAALPNADRASSRVTGQTRQ